MSETAPLDSNHGVLNRSRISNFRHKVQTECVGQPGEIVFGDGNPQGNVCLVGFRPDPEEKKVFTGKDTTAIRDTITGLGIPQFAVWNTYVIKQHLDKQQLVWKDVKPWSMRLFDELEAVRPRATILLGVEVAWAVLGTDEPDVSKLRHIRYHHRNCFQTNFFVTHSPHVVNRHGQQSEIGIQFNQDLMAVFEVIAGYFEKTVIIK